MANPAPPDSIQPPLRILVIADDKAGHQNQSLGLAQAIARYRPIELTQVDPVPPLEAGRCLLLEQRPSRWQGAPVPDLLISTGSGTHLSLLAATRIFPEAFSVLLCTSALPSRLFDLNVVPEHDNHSPGKNIVFTKGVLNKVVPSSKRTPGYGLMLIGGESKHYHWNNRKLIDQIHSVLAQAPQVDWHLTNSRRTPETFNRLLTTQLPQIRFHPWQETPPGWLPEQLANAGKVWVTPDSVSMVYESLTSGSEVYLFSLRSRRTRVARGIEALRGKEAGYLRHNILVEPSVSTTLWEADRIARIVLEKLAEQT